MIKILIITCFIGCINCSNHSNEIKKNEYELQQKGAPSESKIDSIRMNYWDPLSAYEYSITINEDRISVSRDKERVSVSSEKLNLVLKDKNKADEIRYYINLFFHLKSLPIEVSRKHRGDWISSGLYSRMKVIIFENDDVIQSDEIILGNDNYDITYHPKFIKLRSIIQSLIDY